jgi:hypothetical protein
MGDDALRHFHYDLNQAERAIAPHDVNAKVAVHLRHDALRLAARIATRRTLLPF